LTLVTVLGAGAALAATAVAWAVLRGSGRRAVISTAALAVAVAALLSWQHWPALGRHWTQRTLVDAYLQRRTADEPLIAFLMNWKGETFYTRNEVLQVGAQNPGEALTALLAKHPRAWLLVEHARLGFLQRLVPPNTTLEPWEPATTNKFVLLHVVRGS
jgi:hypothetical protein